MEVNFKVPLPKKAVIISDPDLRMFDYQLVSRHEVIGQGSFGVCYRSSYNGKCVVLKECLGKGEDVTKTFLKEAKLLQEMDWKHIVQSYGACYKPLSILLEYLEFSFKPWNSDLTVNTVENFLRFH